MKKAIIFDLDGTLLYTLEDLWIAMNYTLREFKMPERTLDEVRQFVGNGLKRLTHGHHAKEGGQAYGIGNGEAEQNHDQEAAQQDDGG